MKKWTTKRIRATKGKQKIVSLTAYDYSTARIIDDSGIQLVLVGDSLGMTMLGYDSTLPVTMTEMLHHTAAVTRGVQNALVVADMPFMSYQVSPSQALKNAGRFIKEAGADAVKIEGGVVRIKTVRNLVNNGIPVLGHIGLTPQSVKQFGGYNVQGKKPEEAEQLIEDAKQLEGAGIFALVLECLPTQLAGEITNAISVPTIGIGAGKKCDGQILVTHDLLGTYSDISPKFVKQYANVGQTMNKAFKAYAKEVEQGSFPTKKYSY